MSRQRLGTTAGDLERLPSSFAGVRAMNIFTASASKQLPFRVHVSLCIQ